MREKRVVLIACEMIRGELEHVMDHVSFPGDIVWMERGLHEFPKKLQKALQQEIDKWDQKADYLILAYGLCGNSLLGLRSIHAKLVIPRFDDCIRILLSHEKDEPIINNPRSLYYTEGWMESEDSLLSEKGKYVDKYGWEKAMMFTWLMLDGYENVAFIDTGLYDIEACEAKIKKVCDACSLTTRRTHGTLRVYEKMLRLDWDSEFIVTEPEEEVTYAHFADRPRCVHLNKQD